MRVLDRLLGKYSTPEKQGGGSAKSFTKRRQQFAAVREGDLA